MEQNKTILVLEDEKNLREIQVQKLLLSRFNVIEADNGEDGLKTALEKHPDLILLDLAMPVMDGMSMLRKLRLDEWGKTVPVIILTNLTSADEQRNKDITELEPTYYLTKSDHSLEEIVDKIKERLGLVLL